MAQKEVIEIEAKTDKAQKELEKLSGEVQKLTKSQEDTAKSTESIAKSFGSLTKGAIIGVAIKAFEAFTDVLSSNQKVADFFATSIEFLSLAFNDLVSFILDNSQPVVDTFKAIFDDPQQAIKDVGEAIKNNLIERFESFVESAGLAGRAVLAFFDGDFKKAGELAKEAGKELVDVYTGVDGTVDKVTEKAEDLAEAVVEYTTKTYEAAKANVELNKVAERSAVINQGLIEKYDRQAEQQRQIRDEERNTLEERIAANEELNRILDEQEEAMLGNAKAILASAQAQYSKNQSQENEIALIEAQNELLAVQAQIEGFRSEQKANDLALSREQKQLEQDLAETTLEAYEVEQRAQIELLETEQARILATEQLETELHKRRLDLINERLSAEKDGSVAYAEILNERTLLEAEYAARGKEITKELKDANIETKQQEESAKMSITDNAFRAAQSLAEEGSNLAKGLAIAQVLYDTYKGIQAAFASNAANTGATALSGGAWPFIQAAAAAAFGAANLASLQNTSPSLTGGSVATPQAPTIAANTSAPSFNIVAAQQQTNLLNDISAATNKPTRAYVVSKDITTAQELDRNRIESATF